jgi:protein-S-isoprenylcysteine O-methyltransferase Ste14
MRQRRSIREHAERAVASFGFNVFCFLVWGGFTVWRARALVNTPSFIEAVWLAYNAIISILFLVRARPKAVSLTPVHWLVALLTSFSGLFFETGSAGVPGASVVGNSLILLGIAGSGTAAVALGRSYDFLPALRGVATNSLYRYVRHPMYVFSIVIRCGYVLKHLSGYNAIAFLVMVLLYVKRVGYEELIMGRDERYVAYARRVRFRLVPGLY